MGHSNAGIFLLGHRPAGL